MNVLIVGDSLTGLGSIDEALTALAGGDEDAPTLFREEIVGFLWAGQALRMDLPKPRRRRGLEEILRSVP